MKNVFSRGALAGAIGAGVIVALALGVGERAAAQTESTETSAGCVLKDHVYRCDGAAFQRALGAATNVSIATHNVDGVARRQLTELVTKKLGKTVAADGAAADLVFLMEPVGQEGVISDSAGGVDLGTLRIYSARVDGSRANLLWAETYTGPLGIPWPAVVHGLIVQFESRFHIK
jgi:hypothetical protein